MVWHHRLARPVFVLLFIAATSASCASGHGRAVRAYDQARYPEAMAELRQAEGDVARSGAREQARYALYRGLTHLALGDRVPAVQWLGNAKSALDDCPTLLSAEDVGRLAVAWSHLPPNPELAASELATPH